MDEDMTSDLVIAEETPVSKSPEPKIFSDKTEEINNSSNLIENQTDILTTTKIQADQMQLKTNAGDSAGKSKSSYCLISRKTLPEIDDWMSFPVKSASSCLGNLPIRVELTENN